MGSSGASDTARAFLPPSCPLEDEYKKHMDSKECDHQVPRPSRSLSAMVRSRSLLLVSNLLACICVLPALASVNGVKRGLHFSLESRATNIDGSLPTYKNAKASIEQRVADLLPRMTIEEKVSQM